MLSSLINTYSTITINSIHRTCSVSYSDSICFIQAASQHCIFLWSTWSSNSIQTSIEDGNGRNSRGVPKLISICRAGGGSDAQGRRFSDEHVQLVEETFLGAETTCYRMSGQTKRLKEASYMQNKYTCIYVICSITISRSNNSMIL